VAKVAGARDVSALACLAPVGRSWRHTQARIHKACLLGHTPLIEFFMALDLCDGKVFYVVRRQQSELHALHLDKLARLHGKEGTAQPVSRRHARPDPHGSCPQRFSSERGPRTRSSRPRDSCVSPGCGRVAVSLLGCREGRHHSRTCAPRGGGWGGTGANCGATLPRAKRCGAGAGSRARARPPCSW
jgi:hypothetical protein